MTEEIKEELKSGEDTSKNETPSGDVPPVEDGSTDEVKPTVEELQKQLDDKTAENEKLTSDNENYKQGIISKNAKDFSLGEEEVKPEPIVPPVLPPVDETDETKAWDEVNKRAEKIYDDKMTARSKAEEKSNERIAIKKFFANHPEIATNEAVKSGIRDEYVNRNGKSVEGIVMDMEKSMRVWAMENNVELKPKTPDNPAQNIPATPGGNGGEVVKSNDGKAEQAILSVMPDLAGKPELIKQYKEKVLKGEITVPDSVYSLLTT